MDKGILYGVGVGPGDPELLTIKALKVIKECDAIALPVSGTEDKTQITAYQIVWEIYPEINKKRIIFLSMPMTKDKKALQQVHAEGAEQVCRKLDKGENVAFLTLGDVSIYSTFLYIQKLVEASGYETRVIPGVPSFCAAAAALKTGLGEMGDSIHILPGSYDISEGMGLSGTKILMKSGSKIGQVKEELKKYDSQIQMVTNCGMEEEQIYHSLDEIPEQAGYYSLIIAKEGEKR